MTLPLEIAGHTHRRLAGNSWTEKTRLPALSHASKSKTSSPRLPLSKPGACGNDSGRLNGYEGLHMRLRAPSAMIEVSDTNVSKPSNLDADTHMFCKVLPLSRFRGRSIEPQCETDLSAFVSFLSWAIGNSTHGCCRRRQRLTSNYLCFQFIRVVTKQAKAPNDFRKKEKQSQ